MTHPSADLPEFVAGTLHRDHMSTVERHLTGCARCAADAAAWGALSTSAEPPGPHIVAAALRAARVPSRFRWRVPLALARVQLRLVPWLVWVGSAAALVLGEVVSRHRPEAQSLVLPLVLALGIATVADQDRSPVSEVVRATPTSPRAVLLCRALMVTVFDLAVGVPAAGDRGGGLGAAAVLAALAMLAAVVRGAETAAVVAVVVWSSRLAADQDLIASSPVRAAVVGLWAAGPWTFAVAFGLAVAAVVAAGRSEPLRGSRPTTPV
jgi:hypothetical protein